MKASDTFKAIIEHHLSQTAQSDTAFAQNLAKTSKDIGSCINYIFSEVRKTGLCAFADEEIFAMALRYYNDDTIVLPEQINSRAVVNHQPQKADLFTPALLTPSEMAQDTAPVTTPKPAPIPKPLQTTLTLFDL